MAESDIKQVIVWNQSLPGTKGKFGAQVAHAAMSFLTRDALIEPAPQDEHGLVMTTYLTPAAAEWVRGIFKKVILRVDSEEELLDLHDAALKAGLDSVIIEDRGLTVYKEPTITCVAIGPDFADKIDAVTGHLRPL